MRPRKLFAVMVFVLLACNNLGYAKEDEKIYSMAQQAAQSKDLDSAFMYLRMLLASHPDSKYRQEALFATGEYYFLIADYHDAIQAFIKFINDYPDSEGKPFALAYLLKIAERSGKESLVEILEKRIVTLHQLSLLFRDFKEHKYKSALYRTHKVIYYINKVEFYIEGELFAKIPY